MKRKETPINKRLLLKKENIVYIDESGTEECLHRDCGWALRGVPVHGEVSGRKYERESCIAGQIGNRIIAPFCFKGTCNTQVFNAWIRRVSIGFEDLPDKGCKD